MWHREHLNHKEYLNNWLMPSAFVDQQSQDCTAPQTANNVVSYSYLYTQIKIAPYII